MALKNVGNFNFIFLTTYGVVVIASYYLLLTIYTKTQHSFSAIYASQSESVIHRRIFPVTLNSEMVHTDKISGIISPTRIICSKEPFLVIYVHSRAGNYAKRSMIRTTWANQDFYPNTSIELLFMTGYPSYHANGAVMRDVMHEMEHYQDVVLFPVVDTYVNVSEKALLALDYVASRCQRSQFVLKTDDDIVTNLFSVISTLQQAQQGVLRPYVSTRRDSIPNFNSHPINTNGLLMCLTWTEAKPIRNESHKWFISREQYPDDTYPNTCSGSAWIMSTQVMITLNRESRQNNDVKFPFDDVYITGFLARGAGIHHLQIAHHYELYVDEKIKPDGPQRAIVTDKVFFHTSDQNNFHSLWLSILSGPTPQIRPVIP